MPLIYQYPIPAALKYFPGLFVVLSSVILRLCSLIQNNWSVYNNLYVESTVEISIVTCICSVFVNSGVVHINSLLTLSLNTVILLQNLVKYIGGCVHGTTGCWFFTES